MTVPLEGWLVSYDISDDWRRQATAHSLEGLGVRHFLSGFLVPRLQDPEITTLLDELAGSLGPGDGLFAQALCAHCLVTEQGRGIEPPVGRRTVVL